MNQQLMADQLELRALVDQISVLADQKNFHKQVQLFTPHAITEITADGKMIMQLTGREAMSDAFESFNKTFIAAFHLNGQHLISINGDRGDGTLYSQISLISIEEGKKARSVIGAIYHDEYARVNGKWLISARRGTFVWQEGAVLE